MADTFTQERLAWLETVNSDPQASFASKSAALAVALHLNRKSREAFPSQLTIAASMGCKERTAHKAVTELCNLGYLEKRRGGFSKPNHYRLTYPSGISAQVCGNDDPGISAQACGNEASSPAQVCVSVPHNGAYQSRTGVRPNTLIEPFEKEPIEESIYPPPPAPKPAKAKAKVEDERFEAFWSAYPKKVARADALKAFGKALKAADSDTLIAGAMRYAAEQHGKDPTYTKHPATWLNKGCWTDEPAPPRPPSAPAPRGGLTAKDRTAAAVAAVLAQVGGGDHEL